MKTATIKNEATSRIKILEIQNEYLEKERRKHIKIMAKMFCKLQYTPDEVADILKTGELPDKVPITHYSCMRVIR